MSPDKTPEHARALLHGLERDPRRHHQWGLIALSVAMILFALAGLRVASIVAENSQRGQTTQRAGLALCALTVRLIRETGIAATTPTQTSSAQERLAALRLAALERAAIKVMPVRERVEYRRLVRLVARYGAARITVPDCDEVVRHPERVLASIPP